MPKSVMPGRALPGKQLTIELVPKTCWFTNVRSHVPASDWQRCKDYVKARSGNRCEICGGQGDRWPIECHEVWVYVEDFAGTNEVVTRTQQLVDLIALCPACHEVKHIGLAQIKGRMQHALQHLADVNGWPILSALDYTEYAFEIWTQRSQYEWLLDVSWLSTVGIPVPDTTQRSLDNQVPEGEWEPA